jgi:hypothetical protein
MRGNLLVLVFSLAGALGCESGWDIRGEVLTAGVSNKATPLLVYVLDQPSIDPANLPGEPSLYEQLVRADVIPADRQAFKKREFGCHRGAVMVLAWAPRTAVPAAAEPRKPFQPQVGDLVAFSSVRNPYCGPRTKFEEIVFSIDESNVKK